MPGSGHSNGQIPPLFFVILIAYGVIHLLAGSYRWPWFLDNPRLQGFFNRFFVFSTEEKSDYAAAFSILAGIVAIITGVLGLVLL